VSLLFKAVVALSVSLVCGRKRLDAASNGKKLTPWWNPTD